MNVDSNLTKMDQFFHVLMICLQKSPKNVIWLVLLDEIFLDIIIFLNTAGAFYV